MHVTCNALLDQKIIW